MTEFTDHGRTAGSARVIRLGEDMEPASGRSYRDGLVDEAIYGLWRKNPSLSARVVLDKRQKVVGTLMLVVAVVVVIVWPRPVAIAAFGAVGLSFLVSVGFKFWSSMRGARVESHFRTAVQPARMPDCELPKYTVLVPVFKEANIVGQLVDNLGGIDYPADKLEILVLVEEADPETLQAALRADPPTNFSFVVVPASQPQTKPKACNVGLQLATGEFLVIYDAEDKPDPDQLRKAVSAFRAHGDDLVCVQAALNYFNSSENVLTRMFTLEYSFWFDYMLPGLDFERLPIPLGGTSNHFRMSGLRKLGGWDPFNVTEDADLGIRTSAEGMRVGVIDSTTMEEANTSIPNFVRQRSRWIKGYLQTVLVHIRHPADLVRVAGPRQAISFLFLVAGTPATFLTVPILYLAFLISLCVGPDVLEAFFPGWLLWLNLFNLGFGSAMMVYVSMMGAFRRHRYSLVPWAILNPLYWLLHSIAAYKALWQLITKPHYWEKTEHGLTAASAHGSEGPAGDNS
ncbi:glycosyltransferase [Rarobacter incanus]|uniref:Cellulose synthase/poly-beta-1,6-N-acetylglucosamine synthase-like glycosyltransferase n=1 Tax=Rarobacter incanus TaxID=153494 RepID=A0A542SPF7_9MICO|nr:glycosyltransferase [Rarobacter incanus]TQK76496.1 cellulose synthase/poly-beta-1,6-N-acetylglucosamine synthase-like glycosyltransferase [Rarobacter incanus]